MAGEAELDEPFAVDVLGYLLQDLDAPQVVLDQVVVGGEDGGDFLLDTLLRNWRFNLFENCLSKQRLGSSTRPSVQIQVTQEV